MIPLTLKLHSPRYAVVRLDPKAAIPPWAFQGEFFSLTVTPEEMSLITVETLLPADLPAERNWRILQVVGPLDFALIGILSSLSTTLANRKISIFAVSTYDTDYLLVKEDKLPLALEALTEEGHEILQP